MRWSAPGDKTVAEAVIATFRDPVERSLERLAAFKYSQWAQTYDWLDASGMALYFLHRVEALGIEGGLPSPTLGRLRQNLAENRERTAAMFAEFTALNQAFQQAGVEYCNLKGFALIPEYCPDPTLRCQLDLDFLVAADNLKRCREVLVAAGYALMMVTNSVWEFKAHASEMPSIEDLYKPRAQRSVELHFAPSAMAADPHSTDALLGRRTTRSWGGVTFPALSDGDQFVGQAMHVFAHLCSAQTRVVWLLEYARQVSARHNDGRFWDDVRARVQTHRHAPIAIGLATLLSSQIFGCESSAQLDDWTLDRLPATVRLWADRYGREALLADLPGTKLYLLLRDELAHGDSSWQREKRRSLLPIHRAPRILRAGADDTLRKRFGREVFQLRFILFRLRFHVTQGLRYMVAAFLWKRRVAALMSNPPRLEGKADHSHAIDRSRMGKI